MKGRGYLASVSAGDAAWKVGLLNSGVDLLDSFHLGRCLLRAAESRFESELIPKALDAILDEGSSYLHIDVGAYQGWWTHSLAQISRNSSFLLIEANPESAAVLASGPLPARSVVMPVAVTRQEGGLVDLHITRNAVGTSVRRPLPGQSHEWTHVAATEQVVSRRLDRIVEDLAPAPLGILKIDAQGADLEVMESAGALLDGAGFLGVQIEINFMAFYEGQDPWWRCVSYLEERRFRLRALHVAYDSTRSAMYADALFSV
ncbi:MAG: FkbM family methyltransferase [Actinomycetales bacterium]|nr:FkbM family methyltransferase [Actinomycetales bacterium]